jgi:hypothetical protein
MDPVPLLVVQSCESISDKHALKSIRKFLDANSNSMSTLSISHRERISLVPDDVIAKLNVMSTVISEDLQRLKKPDTSEKEKKSKTVLDSEGLGSILASYINLSILNFFQWKTWSF